MAPTVEAAPLSLAQDDDDAPEEDDPRVGKALGPLAPILKYIAGFNTIYKAFDQFFLMKKLLETKEDDDSS